MAQSPEEMAQSMIANMKEKTGKELPEWIALVEARGLSSHGDIMTFLKKEQGMTHGYANMASIKAREAREPAPLTGADLVDAQYAAAKSGLRPIYDALAERVAGFGPDVELSPKKAYVSLRRKKQFGLIKPSTKTRVDVGINLKGVPPTERLEASGSFNSMVSHRVRLSEAGDVDDELVGWLRQAYDAAS